VWALYLILFPGVAWFAPGYAVSRWLSPQATPLERLASSLLLGMLFVVPLAFLGPFLLRIPLTPLWILGAAGVVIAAAAALIRYRPRVPAPPKEPAEAEGWPLVATLVLLALYLALTTVPDHSDAVGLFQVCPHQSAQYLLDDGLHGGLRTWDAEWGRWIAHLASHAIEPGYGLFDVLSNQRSGSMATLVQPIAFHGSGGLVVATFLYELLVLALAALLVARTIRRWWLVLLITAMFMLGVRSVAMYMVNENVLALGFGLGVLYFLLRADTDAEAVIAGACLAICIAVRPIAAAYLPACAVLLWGSRRRAALFVGSLVIAALPWLITQYQVFGHALHHPALGRGQYAQELFGLQFTFHPLNFPVAETIVRPEFDPFPTLFQMPLLHSQAFGAVFWVAVFAGALVVARRRLAAFVLWGLPNYLMLLAIVSLDHQKLSYAVLSFAPLPLLAGAGCRALIDRGLDAQQQVITATVALALLVGFPALIADVDLPVDPREQHNNRRYLDPRSNAAKRAELVAPVFLPTYREHRPDLAWSLLTSSRPPQLTQDVHTGPVLVWRMKHPVDHSFQATLAKQPNHPETLGRIVPLRFTWRYAAISLRLAAAQETVRVGVQADGKTLKVAVETGGAGEHTGYLSLGFVDLQLPDLQGLEVLVDGAPIETDLYIIERPGWGKTLLRLVANHPWQFHSGGGRSKLVAAESPGADCLLVQDNQPFRLRRTKSLRPADPESCPLVQ